MTFEWWFAYLLTSIILSLSPGSGAINTMTTSINHGYRGAAASIAGLQTGLGIHIVLVGVGLGTLFSRSVLAFEVLKWAGAAYLIWLGIQQWRAAGSIDLNTLARTQTRGRLFKRAVFVNLTNPKSIVFLAALFPQFIVPHQPQVMQYVVLGVTTIVVDIIVMIGYATLAFEVLKWAGAAYLIWLGIQQWRAAGSIDLNTLARTQTRGRLFKRAVFVNLTNPKSIVFLAALFPQFIVPHQPQVMQYVVLGVTTIVVDIIVMIGYATLAQRIAAWIKGPKQMKALNKVFGSLFMLVGALLASARHA